MKGSFQDCEIRPNRIAALLAVIYVAASVIYIVVSSRLAAAAAQTIERLEHVELVKGTLFVVTTGGLLYVVALLLLIRVKKQEEILVSQRDTLIASEHRSLAGLFAASVAHDINNVLSVASGNAELLAAPAARAETKENAADAMTQAFVDLSALSLRLMSLGLERREGQMTARDLVPVIERAVQLARRHERVRQCKITTKLAEKLVLRIDEVLIDRMLLNLILNAADATGGTGRIEIRLTGDATTVFIEVHDDGPGVPEDAERAIFEPFYTSKPNGLGLGLVSVKVCAEAHGGSVEVFRSDLGGAAFRVRLPRTAARA
jgi:signal transduction histidine kinase